MRKWWNTFLIRLKILCACISVKDNTLHSHSQYLKRYWNKSYFSTPKLTFVVSFKCKKCIILHNSAVHITLVYRPIVSVSVQISVTIQFNPYEFKWVIFCLFMATGILLNGISKGHVWQSENVEFPSTSLAMRATWISENTAVPGRLVGETIHLRKGGDMNNVSFHYVLSNS